MTTLLVSDLVVARRHPDERTHHYDWNAFTASWSSATAEYWLNFLQHLQR